MVALETISPNINDSIDQLEAEMTRYEPVDCPLYHKFTPGLYSRTIYMPKGSLITSLIHKTEHQFIVSKGIVRVKVNEKEWATIEAPFVGVTMPGTRRVLYIEEDCIWTTVHATDICPEGDSEKAISAAAEKVIDAITEPHVNKYIGGIVINNVLFKTITE
jgi:hypothetical protein